MKPRRVKSSVGLAPCKKMIVSWSVVLGMVAFLTGCAVGRGDDVPQVLHVAMNQDGSFDQYFLQQKLDPPQFSFWPF